MIEIQVDALGYIPEYQTNGSAAVDLHYINEEYVKILPGQVFKVHTGIKLNMANDMCAVVLPRSGLGTKGLVLANGTGLIDSDYQGEIIVPLLNRTEHTIDIKQGDRVAQMMFLPVIRPEFHVVQEFSETTDRGEGGFGSTGC